MSETTGRYTLKRPIERKTRNAEGEKVEQICEIVCRPVEKARDLLVMDRYDGQVAKSMGLIAHLTELSYAEVGELHPDDYDALTDMAQRFT